MNEGLYIGVAEETLDCMHVCNHMVGSMSAIRQWSIDSKGSVYCREVSRGRFHTS